MRVEKSNFTVTRMVRLFEVSRSGFYAWLKREPSDRAVRQERIAQKVAWFHGESDEVSGSPKILAVSSPRAGPGLLRRPLVFALQYLRHLFLRQHRQSLTHPPWSQWPDPAPEIFTSISQMRRAPHFASTLDESRRILVLEPHAA